MPESVEYIPQYPQTNLSIGQFYQDIGYNYKHHIPEFNKYEVVIDAENYKGEEVPKYSIPNKSLQPYVYQKLERVGGGFDYEYSSPFDDPRLLMTRELLDRLSYDYGIETNTDVQIYRLIGSPGDYRFSYIGSTPSLADVTPEPGSYVISSVPEDYPFTSSDTNIYFVGYKESFGNFLASSSSFERYLSGGHINYFDSSYEYGGINYYREEDIISITLNVYDHTYMGYRTISDEEYQDDSLLYNYNTVYRTLEETERPFRTRSYRSAVKHIGQITLITDYDLFVYRSYETGRSWVYTGTTVDYPPVDVGILTISYAWNLINIGKQYYSGESFKFAFGDVYTGMDKEANYEIGEWEVNIEKDIDYLLQN